MRKYLLGNIAQSNLKFFRVSLVILIFTLIISGNMTSSCNENTAKVDFNHKNYFNKPNLNDDLLNSSSNPISISDNLQLASQSSSGDGSSDYPYIIENLIISNCVYPAYSGVRVENTDKYFILRNITVTGCFIGFELNNVTYGSIIGSSATNTSGGFSVMYSSHNNLINNIATNCSSGFTTGTNNLLKNNVAINITIYGFTAGTNSTLINNTVINCWEGFYVPGNNTSLINNTAINSSSIAFDIGYDSVTEIYFNSTLSNNLAMNNGLGFKISSSFNCTFLENKAKNNHIGILIRNSFNISLKKNVAFNNSLGIQIEYSSDLNIDNNIALNSATAFHIFFSSNNSLAGNIANNSMNTIIGNNGFYLERSNNTYVVNNTAINYYSGFFLYASSNNSLISNLALENKVGFVLDQSSNNLLKNNIAKSNEENDFIELNSINNILVNNTFFPQTTVSTGGTYIHPTPETSKNTSISTSPFPLIGLIGAITLIIIIRRNKQNF